jgi:hypothetical protein
MYLNDYLVKDRHDELMRAAAQSRLAARTRRTHRPRPRHLVAAPAWSLVLIRPRKGTA